MISKSKFKIIKDTAKALLHNLNNTPRGLQKVLPEFEPIAVFNCGFKTPNDRKPTGVFLQLNDEVWYISRYDKNWKNMGNQDIEMFVV